jgi:hypothetical protein
MVDSDKQPDLVYYSPFVALKDFEILAKCSTTTEYVASNYKIYANPNLVDEIGFITSKLIQDKYITSFIGYVTFTSFNGTLNYNAINLVNEDQPIFINTITSGNGDLLGVKGYVSSITSQDKKYLTNYVYFDNK